MSDKTNGTFDYYPTVLRSNTTQSCEHKQCDPNVKYTQFPENISKAIAYVAFQENCDSYSAEEALEKGTLFPVLYKPFKGRGVGRV